MSAGQHRPKSRGQHSTLSRGQHRNGWRVIRACSGGLKRLVAVPLLFSLATGVAWAYWSASSGPGGNGASAATSVNQGATPTASSIGSAVTVSWAASTLSNGDAVTGYNVQRYDVGTLTLQTMLSACTGTVAATTCVESSVPAGQWVYSVTPVFATNWSGAESLTSGPVTVDVTAPVNSIALSGVSGNAVKSGDTIYYRGAALGSFTLTNAVTDSGSGPASSTAETLTGTTTNWTHTQTTVSTPAGGPYVSTVFSWTAGATSSPTEVVTGRDVANNATGTTLTFVNDSTGPTGGSVAASGLVGTGALYAISATLSLDLAKGTDPAGVATTGAQLLRATATLTSAGTADGTCGTYGTYTLVTGGNDPTTPKSEIVADQACYRYQYVVADTLGNSTTYTSADIKVDLTAPTPAPSLTFGAFTNTYWTSGSTVFYRSAAPSGSFTTTASATDTGSGILSYAFPALGTNWTSTPGPLGVNTYSWTTGPAVPGAESVTATNNATGTSSGTSFTPTADDTDPTGDTLTYADTTITSTSFSVDFTNGTDTGSGVRTRVLRRATATLTGTTCGSFGAYLLVAANPTSPYVDTVSTGNCYMYRYRIVDNVGNVSVVSSANVVKVTSYFDRIVSTSGLVNYWRLGESTTSSDSFTGTTGATLQSRTGEIGATWTKHTLSSTTDSVITGAGRIRKNGTTAGALYSTSGVPSSADYMVEADVYRATSVTDDMIGVVGRMDPAVSTGTFYSAVYDRLNLRWALYSTTTGTKTLLGSYGQTLSTLTYRLALDMSGSTIRVLVNGVERVSVVNTAITAAGSGGVTMGFGATNTNVTDTTGMHLDNFNVAPALADSYGANTGDYFSGPTLGVAGALATDSNTAAKFDGVDDFGTVARQIADDFSIEFWFKSTQGIGTGTQWWNGAGLVDAEMAGAFSDFGVSLRSDGRVVAGVGGGFDTSIVSTSGAYNNGAWHHVVFTRTRTSGALQLYVDGAAAGSATGSTVSLTSPANINFGRLQTGINYFSGSLDEVALYNSVLSGPMVTTHYNAAQ